MDDDDNGTDGSGNQRYENCKKAEYATEHVHNHHHHHHHYPMRASERARAHCRMLALILLLPITDFYT